MGRKTDTVLPIEPHALKRTVQCRCRHAFVGLREFGNSSGRAPVWERSSRSSSTACLESGTMCGSRIFMRSAGMRHCARSRSNSPHSTLLSDHLGHVQLEAGIKALRIRFMSSKALVGEESASADSTPSGHPVHAYPAGHSTHIRPPVPRPSGGRRSRCLQPPILLVINSSAAH